MKVKKLCYMSLLTAIALIIFIVEAQIPELVPIPGVKLGLANIVTLWALYTLGPLEAVIILLCRVIIGSIFSGQIVTLFYSLGGGLLSIAVMVILKRFFCAKQMWVLSVIGAIFHNIGQLIVAMLLLQSVFVWAYLPVLIISAIITGAFTGLCAQLLYKKLSKIRIYFE